MLLITGAPACLGFLILGSLARRMSRTAAAATLQGNSDAFHISSAEIPPVKVSSQDLERVTRMKSRFSSSDNTGALRGNRL